MTVWCIVIVALLLLLILPLGVDASYLDKKGAVKLKIGPILVQILPKKGKNKSPEPGDKKEKPKAAGEPRKKQPRSSGDIVSLAKLALDLLARLRRRLSIDLLQLRFVAGSEDPYRAVMLYGRANAILASLLPPARLAFKLRQEEISTAVDFNRSLPMIEGRLVATLQVWELIYLAVCALWAFLKWKRQRKQKLKTVRQPA